MAGGEADSEFMSWEDAVELAGDRGQCATAPLAFTGSLVFLNL